MEVSFWLMVSLEPLFLKARQPYVKMITLLWSCMMALATLAAWTKSAGRAVGRWDHVSARQAPHGLGGVGCFSKMKMFAGKEQGLFTPQLPISLSFLLGTTAVTSNSSHEGHPCTSTLSWFWHIFNLTGFTSTSSIWAWFWTSMCSVHITFIHTVLTLSNLLMAYRNRVLFSKWHGQLNLCWIIW